MAELWDAGRPLLSTLLADVEVPVRRRRKPRIAPPDGLKTAAEAAAKLRCSIKTFNGHVESGALRYVAIGHGMKRQRKLFTDADINEFIENQKRKDVPCLSAVTRARRSGSTTFKSEVVAFSDRRSARYDGKRKP